MIPTKSGLTRHGDLREYLAQACRMEGVPLDTAVTASVYVERDGLLHRICATALLGDVAERLWEKVRQDSAVSEVRVDR